MHLFFFGLLYHTRHKPKHKAWSFSASVVGILLIATAGGGSTTTTILAVQGMRLDVGIPGIGAISYRDGLLRIRPTATTNKDHDDEGFEEKNIPRNAFRSDLWKSGLPIVHKKTPTKGYGAFYTGTEPLPGGTFLGLYRGRLVKSREELDELHATRRRRESTTRNDNDNENDNVSGYVMSLDGGVHFLDGYEFRYKGDSNSNIEFTPAHLNHAGKDTPECNVLRRLVYVPDDDDVQLLVSQEEDFEAYPKHLPRVAFFAARDISTGEELCFDYGTNFWGGDKGNIQ